ncbi:glycosyltransferase, partial [Planctomycetota bacterium]
LPTALLEAMAMHVPVVSNNLPQAGEIISHGDNGFLIDMLDVPSAAKHMLEILAQPEKLEKTGASGRRTVAEKFTIQKMVADYCSLYEELWQQQQDNKTR